MNNRKKNQNLLYIILYKEKYVELMIQIMGKTANFYWYLFINLVE